MLTKTKNGNVDNKSCDKFKTLLTVGAINLKLVIIASL